MAMDTDISEKGIDSSNITLIENMHRTINRTGYVVLEWGINLITVDFNNKRVTWNETGTSNELYKKTRRRRFLNFSLLVFHYSLLKAFLLKL